MPGRRPGCLCGGLVSSDLTGATLVTAPVTAPWESSPTATPAPASQRPRAEAISSFSEHGNPALTGMGGDAIGGPPPCGPKCTQRVRKGAGSTGRGRGWGLSPCGAEPAWMLVDSSGALGAQRSGEGRAWGTSRHSSKAVASELSTVGWSRPLPRPPLAGVAPTSGSG